MSEFQKGGLIPPKSNLSARKIPSANRPGVATSISNTRGGTSSFDPSTPAVPTAPGSVAQPSRIPESVRQYAFPAGGAALAAGGAFLAGLAMPIIATGAILGALGGHLLSKKV